MNEKISDQDFVIPPIPPKLEKKAEVLPKDTTFGMNENGQSTYYAPNAQTEEEKTNLWVAPTKGGVFTTVEREVMKSTEFRKASGEGQ